MSEFRLLLYSYESSAKIAQASAMRIYSQIAERSFIFCKDRQLNRYCQTFLHLKTFSSFFPPFFTFLPFYTSKTSCRFALLLPVSQWVYDKSRVRLSLHLQRPRSLIRVIRDIRVPLTTQATEPTDLIRALRDIRVPLTTQAAEPTGLIRAIRDIRVRLSLQQQRPRSLIRIHSRYYFPLISGSTTNLVFVSLTRTFPLSLFALHSQTSLPVPTSPPSCISTARCPPQPRYSHRDHLSQPTYP